jgi:ribosome-binding protein aMBF1 (putative translation factor)
VWNTARKKLIRLQGKAQRESDEALKKIQLLENVIEEIKNKRKSHKNLVETIGGVRLSYSTRHSTTDKNMNIEREKKTHAPLTGRRYDSVQELMAGESVSHEVRSAVAELDKETRIVDNLVQMRKAAGLTQQQLAQKLGKTQGAISKMESSLDSEVTLDELRSYRKFFGNQSLWRKCESFKDFKLRSSFCKAGRKH